MYSLHAESFLLAKFTTTSLKKMTLSQLKYFLVCGLRYKTKSGLVYHKTHVHEQGGLEEEIPSVASPASDTPTKKKNPVSYLPLQLTLYQSQTLTPSADLWPTLAAPIPCLYPLPPLAAPTHYSYLLHLPAAPIWCRHPLLHPLPPPVAFLVLLPPRRPYLLFYVSPWSSMNLPPNLKPLFWSGRGWVMREAHTLQGEFDLTRT